MPSNGPSVHLMGIASIVLGILSLLFAVGGFLVSFIPGVGAFVGVFLCFTAPVLALLGIVLGGVGVSRAREEGTEGGSATAGLIVSIIAFFPAFLVAITCGICDTMCAGAMLEGQNDGSQPWWLVDAGTGTSPGLGSTPPTYPAPIDPPPSPTIDPPPDPAQPPGDPPPAFPPPPMDDPAPPDPAP